MYNRENWTKSQLNMTLNNEYKHVVVWENSWPQFDILEYIHLSKFCTDPEKIFHFSGRPEFAEQHRDKMEK